MSRLSLSHDGVMQGSLVTQDRLRFDFNLHRGLREGEIAKVEELVNGWVAADTELVTKEMPLADAKAAGKHTAHHQCRENSQLSCASCMVHVSLTWSPGGSPSVMNIA